MSHENMDKCFNIFEDYRARSSRVSLYKLDLEFMQKVFKEFTDGTNQFRNQYKDSKFAFNGLVIFLDHCQAGRWTDANINFNQAKDEYKTFARTLDATRKNSDNLAKYDQNSITTKSSTTDIAKKSTDRDKSRDAKVTIYSPIEDQSFAQALRDKHEITLKNTTGKTLPTSRNAATLSNQGQSVQQTSRHINPYDSINYKDTQEYKREHLANKSTDRDKSRDAKVTIYSPTEDQSFAQALRDKHEITLKNTTGKTLPTSINAATLSNQGQSVQQTPRHINPYDSINYKDTQEYKREHLAKKSTDRDKSRDAKVTIYSPTEDQSFAQALRDKHEITLKNTTGKTLPTARNAATLSNQGQSVQQTSRHINPYDSINYNDTQEYKREHHVGKHQDDITDKSNAKLILQNVTPGPSMEKGLSSPEYHTNRKSEDVNITKPKMTQVLKATSVTPSTTYQYYDNESNETDIYRNFDTNNVNRYTTIRAAPRHGQKRSKDTSMRLKQDKLNISDLSDPNRPSKLTERFSELYSNEYTDALDELNGTNSNPVESIQYLLDIVKAAYLFCTKRRKQMNDEQIKHTGSSTDDHVRRYEMELRKTAEEVLPNVRQEFMKPRIKVMQESTQWFAEQCVEIVWLMCIQQLPMHLEWVEKKREKFNPDLYKDYTKSGKFIEFCVWPIVRLHENGPILTRGIAQGCD